MSHAAAETAVLSAAAADSSVTSLAAALLPPVIFSKKNTALDFGHEFKTSNLTPEVLNYRRSPVLVYI